MIGRVVVMVLGFVPAVMFVTGFMRWNQKRAHNTPLLILERQRAAEVLSAVGHDSLPAGTSDTVSRTRRGATLAP